ncbi:hypothetical protein CKO28_21125 [Rhodovibrio sodomensis]|uniref:IS110 family transposase n=1 Tax=Rhodovibrio sodomensis TaxID=1088 RepID=A0ABS1DJL8_9PROT|nr:IS110 family transposase [Rhodovibrio sodomensis]MBK1670528.1 hypothetical protein [Rhodovibrio sodomensis]
MDEATLGVDTGKTKLQLHLIRGDGRKRKKGVDNTADGHAHLKDWLAKHADAPVRVVLEATGRYWMDLAMTLHEAGYIVSVVNPARVKHFQRVQLGRGKSDRIDAHAVAQFGRLLRPTAWTPPPAAVLRLRDLVRIREQLVEDLTAHRNQLQAGRLCDAARRVTEQTIADLEQRLAGVERAIRDEIPADPELARRHALLVSIPGIATETAAGILVELPDVSLFQHAKQVAAYAGVSPAPNQSGDSLDKPARICRIGNANLRRMLYMPALAARRQNSCVRALDDRLAAKGRLAGKQRVAAAMRKLLVLCYGVLKTGQPFDPNWAATPA